MQTKTPQKPETAADPPGTYRDGIGVRRCETCFFPAPCGVDHTGGR